MENEEGHTVHFCGEMSLLHANCHVPHDPNLVVLGDEVLLY